MNFTSDNHRGQSSHHSQGFQEATWSPQLAPITGVSNPESTRAVIKNEEDDRYNLQYPESPSRPNEASPSKQEEPVASTSYHSSYRRTSHTLAAKAPVSTEHNLATHTTPVIGSHHEALSRELGNHEQEITPQPKRKGGAVVGKRFGSIPGFNLFETFDYREEFADLHPPRMAGIYSDFSGAYSVVMSGGYIDDRDEGNRIIYTGEGGRDNKTSASTGKESFSQTQTKNQEWTRGNKGLQLNVTTRNPIRLVRGPYKKLRSPYAHADKYRYDGLYTVERAWQEVGQEGFLMCRFEFKRLPGQPEIPRLSDDGLRPRARTKRPSPRETAAANHGQEERSLKRLRIPELPASSTIAGSSTHVTRSDPIVRPEPVSSSAPSGKTVPGLPQPQPTRVITQIAVVNPTPSTSAASFFSTRRPLLMGAKIKREPE